MLVKIQVTQLIAEGDRQLQAGKYELAIKQFQQALQLKPITLEILGVIEEKCEYTFTKWAAPASSAPSNTGSEIQSHKQAIERLQNEIQQKSKELAKIEQENSLIGSAGWFDRRNYPSHFKGGRCPVCGATQGHWKAANGHDFGSTLPKQNTLGLASLRRATSNAEDEIAKHNAVIASLQAGAKTSPQMPETIQSLRSQLSSEITNAKSLLTGQPPKMEIAPVVVNTEVVQQVTTAPTETMQPTPPQSAISSQEFVQPVESQPVVAQARDLAPKATPPSQQPWWKEYWYLIAIGIVGAIYILRR